MMEQLIRRGGAIAREAQRETVNRVAERLKALVGNATVEGSSIMVSGSGLMRKWLADSRLRFIGSELK